MFGVQLALLGALALRLHASTRRHRDQLAVVMSIAGQLPPGTVLEANTAHGAGSWLRVAVSGIQHGSAI
jgi:hypothetical protein